MEFNWEEFISSDNIAVHCATEEQAIDFCKQMHEHGLEWRDRQSYLKTTNWERYEKETCYEADGSFANLNYYKYKNYTILEWSNYEKENSMNDLKKLLRQGYVVEHMDGELSRVEMNAEEELIISGEYRWFPVENLTEQLEYICYFTNDKDYAPKVKIKAIYGLAEMNYNTSKTSTDGRKIIWKRGKENMNLELTNLTDEQKQQIIESAKKFEQENEVNKLDYDNDYIAINGTLDFPRKYEFTECEFKDQFFDLGLTAHTKEEAEKIRRRLLVEKELRDWAKKCKEPLQINNPEVEKYMIAYETISNKVYAEPYFTHIYGEILFSEQNVAEQAIESIGKERLIRDYFAIE